jgi:hypothetical protein
MFLGAIILTPLAATAHSYRCFGAEQGASGGSLAQTFIDSSLTAISTNLPATIALLCVGALGLIGLIRIRRTRM